MADEPRSNRPTPRTAAAVEAELRRRVRTELAQARSDAADGQLDDAVLADIIARAVASALTWHLEAPEHTRNATLSSRSWRPAGGPRAGGPRDFEDRPSRGPRRDFDRDRDYSRPPRDFDRDREYPRGPREFDRDRDYPRAPRDYDRDRDRDLPRGPRDFDDRPGPRGGGGFKRGGFPKRGGFGPRRPPPRGR